MRRSEATRFSGQHRVACARPWPLAAGLGLCVSLILLAASLLAQQRPTDYQVKAAYLYNFGKFVQWPANPSTQKDSLFSVCVLGQDPFGPALDATLSGASIGGQRVVARRISSPEESVNCRILFLGATEAARMNKIIQSLDKEAVLTVSDLPEFSQRGGMIQFVTEGNRVRFEVNLEAAQQAGLTLSSELLKVATTVRRNSTRKD